MRLQVLAKEYILDCQVRGLAAKSISNYTKQIGYFLRYLERQYGIYTLEELRPIHIKQYILSLQKKKNKPSYINDLIKPIKCLCSYAFQEGYTDEIITMRIKNVKEPKVLIHTFGSEEITALIRYYDKNDYLSVRNRLILMILFDTGIRISELLNLTTGQIREGYFIIYGKGDKERTVPLNPMVSKWMIKYDAVREDYFTVREAEDYYFLSKNGKRLTREAVCKFMKEAANAVGINPMVRISPHTCRHTFAHQELKNGLDLYSLSRVLGHSNVSITQRYLEAIQDAQVLSATRKAGVLAHL